MTFKIFSSFVIFIISLTLINLGCKKDEDNPASPPGSTTTSYGSGTVTTTSSAGSFSITGTGVFPLQANPSVLAVYDTTGAGAMGVGGALQVFGYQQVSGPNFNVLVLFVIMPTAGVVAGTYSYPNSFGFGAAYNADTTLFETDTASYAPVSGSLVVNPVTGSNASGTYSVMARKGTGPLIQFTGTFNVAYVHGVFPDTFSQMDRPSSTSYPFFMEPAKSKQEQLPPNLN